MSWREQALLSLFVHLFVAAFILFFPMLPFVRAAEVARQERLMELAELQQAQPMVIHRCLLSQTILLLVKLIQRLNSMQMPIRLSR